VRGRLDGEKPPSTRETVIPFPTGGKDHNGDRDAARLLSRQANAVGLRLAGATYPQIAEALGYDNAANARRVVVESLRLTAERDITELRDLENARLDRMLQGLWPKVINGDSDAINSALRISQRRAKLNGLDAPVRVVITDDTAERIRALAAEIDEQVRNFTVPGEVVPNAESTPPAGDEPSP
jgi:hypothetical protein